MTETKLPKTHPLVIAIAEMFWVQEGYDGGKEKYPLAWNSYLCAAQDTINIVHAHYAEHGPTEEMYHAGWALRDGGFEDAFKSAHAAALKEAGE